MSGLLKVVRGIELTKRQKQIVEIVKEEQPITGECIADKLNVSRGTLRPDLSILTKAGFLAARPRVGYFYVDVRPLSYSLQKLIIGEYMSDPVVVVENLNAYEAILVMFSKDIGTLFVVDEGSSLVGVVSRKDLLRTSIGKQELTTIPVHMIMTRMPNVAYCETEDTLVDAAMKLIDKQVDALPIIQKDGNKYTVIGRITKTTITQAFVQHIK